MKYERLKVILSLLIAPMKKLGLRKFRFNMIIRDDFPFAIKKYTHSHTFPPGTTHVHDFFEIVYIVAGEGIHTYGRLRTSALPGDVFLVRPFEKHRIILLPGQQISIINCIFLPSFIDEHTTSAQKIEKSSSFSFVEPFYREKTKKLVFPFEVYDRIKYIFQEMLDEYKNKDENYQLAMKAMMLELLVILRRSYITSKNTSDMTRAQKSILSVIKTIHDNYKNTMNLADTAARAGMSKHYFCTQFKKATGMSFIPYVTRVRLEKAVFMIRSTNIPISDICLDNGFSDVSNFNHVFKKRFGLAPLKLRGTS